jgi:MFS transporter, PHS family, inorganic phosphate transporter
MSGLTNRHQWTPTKLRGVMMASVFLMQSLGQLTASAVAYGVAVHHDKCQGKSQSACDLAVAGRAVDQFWRTVIGVGAFPAMVAILLRFSMRESARWKVSVLGERLEQPSQAANGAVPGDLAAVGPAPDAPNGAMNRRGTSDSELLGQFDCSALATYLSEGAWKRVAGVSLCWFIVDVGYYGLGLNSQRVISRLWKADSTPPPEELFDWVTDLVDPSHATIFQVLWRNSARNMITVSTGSIAGSIAIIAIINFVPRRKFMAITFGFLAVIFIIFASTLFSSNVYQGHRYRFTVFMYAFIQFLFNVGPNALTWILPAEIFCTKYRGTLYGVAAAWGKIGAILVQGIFRGVGLGNPQAGTLAFAVPLYIFAAVMMAGVLAARLVPEVQILASDIIDERTERFQPMNRRSYPCYGWYRSLTLERLELELDARDNAGTEMSLVPGAEGRGTPRSP